jgi:hypothetical protein
MTRSIDRIADASANARPDTETPREATARAWAAAATTAVAGAFLAASPEMRLKAADRADAGVDFAAVALDVTAAVDVAVRDVDFFAVTRAVPAAKLRAVAEAPLDGVDDDRAIASDLADAVAAFLEVADALASPEQDAVTVACLTATTDAEPRARLVPVAGAEGFDAATVGGVGRLRHAAREGMR